MVILRCLEQLVHFLLRSLGSISEQVLFIKITYYYSNLFHPTSTYKITFLLTAIIRLNHFVSNGMKLANYRMKKLLLNKSFFNQGFQLFCLAVWLINKSITTFFILRCCLLKNWMNRRRLFYIQWVFTHLAYLVVCFSFQRSCGYRNVKETGRVDRHKDSSSVWLHLRSQYRSHPHVWHWWVDDYYKISLI